MKDVLTIVCEIVAMIVGTIILFAIFYMFSFGILWTISQFEPRIGNEHTPRTIMAIIFTIIAMFVPNPEEVKES